MRFRTGMTALATASLLMAGGLIGCDDNDSVGDNIERAGDKVENATEKAADKIEDSADKAADKVKDVAD